MNEQSGTIWYRTLDGTLVEQSGTPAPVVPEDCERIDPNEYFAHLDAVAEAEEEAMRAERAAAKQREAMIEKALAFYLASLPGAGDS